jgi:hypothetical protein
MSTPAPDIERARAFVELWRSPSITSPSWERFILDLADFLGTIRQEERERAVRWVQSEPGLSYGYPKVAPGIMSGGEPRG